MTETYGMKPEETYLLDEPTDFGICKDCEVGICRLPSGAWRSTTTDLTVDRVACTVAENKHHRPLEAKQP